MYRTLVPALVAFVLTLVMANLVKAADEHMARSHNVEQFQHNI